MNQKSLDLWQHRIADRKISGLNITDWCKKNNLSKHAYYYWLKRIEVNTLNTNSSRPVFAEIEPSSIIQTRNVKSDLQITWKDVHITIGDSNTAKLAAEFITQLQKLC